MKFYSVETLQLSFALKQMEGYDNSTDQQPLLKSNSIGVQVNPVLVSKKDVRIQVNLKTRVKYHSIGMYVLS